MDSLLAQIKKQQLQARKDKNTLMAQSLTTLIGEAEMVGKNDGNRSSTDAEVIAVIKKFIKNIDEAKSAADKGNMTEKSQALQAEKDLLNSFLPKQLSEEEIRTIIGNIVNQLGEKSPKMMGKVLGSLKESHAGLYDGALASKVAKELLN